MSYGAFPNNKRLQTKCINYGGKEMKRRFINASKKVLAIAMSTAMMLTSVVVSNPMEVNAAYVENPETLDCSTWWTNFTTGYKIDTTGINVSCTYQTNAGATDNFAAPAIIVYTSDNGNMDGANYECYAIIRADLYAVAQGNWSYGCYGADWTNLGFKKVNLFAPAENNDADDGTDTDAYEWKDWLAENIASEQRTDVIAKRDGNYVSLTFNNNGVAAAYDIPVKDGKDVYFAYTGDRCILSDFETSAYTGEVVESHAFWRAMSKGFSVDDDGLNLSLHTVTDTTGTLEYHAPYFVVYQGTDNVVWGAGYTEIGVVRCDYHGWGNGFVGKEKVTDLDWDAYVANMLAGVDVEVQADISGSTLTIDVKHQGANFRYQLTIDPTLETYISVGGERCTVTNLKENDANTEVMEVLGAQAKITDTTYSLGFITTIDKTTFDSIKEDIVEMGILMKNNVTTTSLALLKGNVGNYVKKVTTSYVTDLNVLDSTKSDDSVYAFRSIVTGVSLLYKDFTAVPYVTYMDGEEEVTVYGDALSRCIHDCVIVNE